MHSGSDALRRAGVRHALVGGLAVGAYGYPRGTKDVDFLVGTEAFLEHADGVVCLKEGVPIQVAGIAVALVAAGEDEAHLVAALADAEVSGDVPVAPAGVLAYLKLKSPGRRTAPISWSW
jgi:hypothetical protein